jgi:hypothetical protein
LGNEQLALIKPARKDAQLPLPTGILRSDQRESNRCGITDALPEGKRFQAAPHFVCSFPKVLQTMIVIDRNDAAR